MPDRVGRCEDRVDHPDHKDQPCYGQWCCGCAEHPVGKPWGWNYRAWEEHNDEAHALPSQPAVTYLPEDFG